ncbi:MAG TPA: hypothetical protein VK974_02255 [Methylophilaceae bacterium]|nr:hypothetical protein [Methylophilaceae bacterium]
MKNYLNNISSTLVKVNYYSYFAIGIILTVAFQFLIGQSLASEIWFLVDIAPAIIFSSLLIRFFCQIFYQEKYEDFDFRKVHHNMHIGIPRKDFIFHSVISKNDLNKTRVIAGYIYAFSKPVIFIMLGVSITTLLFVMHARG